MDKKEKPSESLGEPRTITPKSGAERVDIPLPSSEQNPSERSPLPSNTNAQRASSGRNPYRTADESKTPFRRRGFQNSKKRILIEISILIAAIALLLWLLHWGLRASVGVMLPLIPRSVDQQIGELSWEASQDEFDACDNPEIQQYIESIAAPLISEIDGQEDQLFNFKFTVIENSEVNAFALPGGFVTVHTGLIEAADSGEEIAAVLAHELSHVTLRHGTARTLRKLGGMAIVMSVLGSTDFEKMGLFADNIISTAYDRDQERDADSEGRKLMKKAGLNPVAMAIFFERLQKEHPIPAALTVLSTHPDPGERAASSQDAAKGFEASRTLPKPPKTLHCSQP